MYSRYPDELTCDMAETYGIFDIKRVPVQLLATLAVGLRDNSRVKMAMTQTPVRDETVLLAMIADYVHWIQWSMTQAAQDGGKPPKSVLDFYLGIDREETLSGYSTPEEFEAERKRILEGL